MLDVVGTIVGTLLGMKRRFLGTARWLIALLAVVVVARVAAPWFVKRYVNGVLKNGIDGYTGYVQDVDLSLWRGAYQLQGLHLDRVENKVPVPFLDVREADLMIAWKPLLKGRVVGKIDLDRARVNFVRGPDRARTQSGLEGDGWQKSFQKLFPLRLNALNVRESEVHYLDFHSKPKVDVRLDRLRARVTNLSNVDHSNDELPSSVRVRARVQKTGRLSVTGRTDILKAAPAFDADVKLTRLELPEFNDFLRAYAHFDVARGRLDVYSEATSRDRRIKGYVKPFLTNVDVIQNNETFRTDQEFWSELGASAFNLIVRRYPKDQLATEIPFEGRLEQPRIGWGSSVRGMFRHAFVSEVVPKVDHDISARSLSRSKGPPASRKVARP